MSHDPHAVLSGESSNSHIIGRYYLGPGFSFAYDDHDPVPDNIKCLVLCAKEIPRKPRSYLETVIGPPHGFDDVEGDRSNLIRAQLIAADVIRWAAANDGDILFTCWAGLNRSALVLGLVLRVQGVQPDHVLNIIQKQRPGSLSNPDFARWLLSRVL